MPHINIVDSGPIGTWLEHIARERDPDNREIFSDLLIRALKKPLLRHEASAEALIAPPPDAPRWLVNKWDTAGPFHRFSPDRDPELQEKARHIMDWLASAYYNKAPFLEQLDPRRVPYALAGLKTVDEAYAKANEYFGGINKKFMKSATAHKAAEGTQTVMELSDGARIVELTTTDALKLEGADMGHCLGGGSYDKDVRSGRVKIYSLRDRNNAPHVTFEVKAKGNILLQCKGKEDEPPVARYMPYVEAFARARNFRLAEAPRFMHLLQDKSGAIHSIFSLPEGLTIPGSLDLSETPIALLPKNLKVEGGFLDLTNTLITRLPEGLQVAKKIVTPDGRVFQYHNFDAERAWENEHFVADAHAYMTHRFASSSHNFKERLTWRMR
jgi:hypothetical protein